MAISVTSSLASWKYTERCACTFFSLTLTLLSAPLVSWSLPTAGGMGKRVRGEKVRKLVSWDRNSLISEEKLCGQESKINNLFTTSHQEADKNIPPSSSIWFQLILLSTLYGIEYSFDQLWSAILSQLFVLSHPVCLGEAEWVVEKALMLYKLCSETANILLCYQHCFYCKSKTQRHSDCYDKN